MPLHNPFQPEVLVASLASAARACIPASRSTPAQISKATRPRPLSDQSLPKPVSGRPAGGRASSRAATTSSVAEPARRRRLHGLRSRRSSPPPIPAWKTTAPLPRPRLTWPAARPARRRPHEERAAPLAGALRDARFEVEVRGPGRFAACTMGELQRFDLFMLSDVSALSMTRTPNGPLPDLGPAVRRRLSSCSGARTASASAATFARPSSRCCRCGWNTTTGRRHAELSRCTSCWIVPARWPRRWRHADQDCAWLTRARCWPWMFCSRRDLFGLTAVDTQVHTVVPLAPGGESGGGGAEDPLDHGRRRRHLHFHRPGRRLSRSCAKRRPRSNTSSSFSDADDAEEKSGRRHGRTARRPGGGNSADLVSAMLAEKISDIGRGSRRGPVRTRMSLSCASWRNGATAGSISPTTPRPCRRSSAPKR